MGVLCGTAATSIPVLLQACTIRVLSRHAELSPRSLTIEHTATSLLFVGLESQTTRALEDVEGNLAATIQKHEAILNLLSARIGRTREDLQVMLATEPDLSAPEAVAAGWADVVV